MRKVLLSIATGISWMLFAGSAWADGMPRGGLKDVGCAQPFKGFYVGAHAGFGQFTSHQNDLSGFLTDNSSWTTTESGFTGGVTVGYNWQRGCHVLFGIEADWAWGEMEAKTTDEPFGTPGTWSTTLNQYGTLRTRTGLVFDNLLLYVTGGLAVAEIDLNIASGGAVFSASDTRWGWTTGVGTELILANNVTLKSEVLYMDFGDQGHNFVSGGTPFNFRTQDNLWVGRMGLNYKF